MSEEIVAVSIQRRCIAVAVFSGMRLERMEVRQLSSNGAQAATTVHRLITRLLRAHPVMTAALESTPAASTTRRAELVRLVHTLFTDKGLYITTTGVPTLLAAYSLPPCRTRKRLREIVSGIWPALQPRFGTSAVLDAAALGLHAEVQSYLTSNHTR